MTQLMTVENKTSNLSMYARKPEMGVFVNNGSKKSFLSNIVVISTSYNNSNDKDVY